MTRPEKKRALRERDARKIENTSLIQKNLAENDPIFIHTSFRSGSTWFWSKFRNNKKTVSYYEYFNDGLSQLDAVTLESNKPASWDSRHPHTNAYFLEFLPFLQSSGGIEGFDRCMNLDRFIPFGGLSADLSQQEIDYVSRLIELAQASRRVPVLSETRTLGRIAGLRRAFGGTHILLHRNLFQQWSSYCYFHHHNNPYFFSALLQCLKSGSEDPFFAKLGEYGKRQIKEELEHLTADEWLAKIDTDSLFVLFAGFHVYLLMHALSQADIVVDITRLARQVPEGRQNLQLAIRQATGLSINLSDVADSIEAPLIPLNAPDSARETLDSFFRLAVRLSEPDPRQIAFGEEILESLWQEHDRYAFYTRSLRSLLTRKTDELDAVRRQHEEETRARTNAESTAAEATAESVRLREALEAARASYADETAELQRAGDAEAERLRSALAEGEQTAATLSEEIECLQTKLKDMRSSRAAEVSDLHEAITAEERRADEHSSMAERLRGELGALRTSHVDLRRV